jgi:hypothetical protein
MSFWVTTIPVSVSVTFSIPMIVARRAMLAATPTNAAAAGAAGNRRWRCCLRFALFPVLSEFHQHVPQLVIAQVHLCQRFNTTWKWQDVLRIPTFPPKWSANRRSESRTDR